MEAALESLIRNSLVAIDEMYFTTSALRRNRPSFRHRTCIRIQADKEGGTLSISDMGIGMTRADLINSLGVGASSSMSTSVLSEVSMLDEMEDEIRSDGKDSHIDDENNEEESYECDNSNVMDEKEEEETNSSDSDSESGSESQHTTNTNENIRGVKGNYPTLRIECGAKELGGFYSSLCSLATGARVTTKSRHDDYYEFEVGIMPSNTYSDGKDKVKSITSNNQVRALTHFSVSRPMAEGKIPSLSNGFSGFCDVRGECGTTVILHLSEKAISKGYLDEDGVLAPLVGKVLETSSYRVAFYSKCSVAERKEIIEANQIEEEDLAKLNDSTENVSMDWNDDTDENNANDINKTSNLTEMIGSFCPMRERAKYVPLRLSLSERKRLRLVEAAMTCCDYTTEVDTKFRSKARRTHAQLAGINSVLRGLVTACDYAAGKEVANGDDDISQYSSFFQQMFEIARRHKIMNPEKMRTEYGKLVYLLQDAVSPTIQPFLSFSCKGSIETVHKFLESRGGLKLLDDNLIIIATQEVLAEKKSRAQINNEIKRKENAVAQLKKKYQNSKLSSDDIHLCLYSICDNDSFLNSNRVPIDKIIKYLQKYFSPSIIEEEYSLAIVSGMNGARLSHNHERQYYFALQSLTLWRDIIDDMFRLWAMAEEDLLSESVSYELRDTGQGMQRVQQSPLTYKAMRTLLGRVQGKVNNWIGSSVVHMGDHNVPNSLTFIDKYTQVPRILGPIVTCLENLERLVEDDAGIKCFIYDGFGGLEKLKKDILYDFFRSAFDGSGADNFYDAGSCIDGRLTSAWNWCSQLPNKSFYCIFKLTGFTGFDGEFK
eukprot:CAMPEP_0184865140 /NCGR_PEP_ID=MMETSP0580-20130426/17097_1 /TAXON_ID=1118495 /ORGANISM="Dactyliosolen fragilissimus" /LENGTH=827 /DNA_ID=CAMNT_0027364215 /DNA_START=162 /DNA_END=2645 /DNA_ORIENTATION=+